MTTHTDRIRQMSPQEMSERVRAYHEAMEPHIQAFARLLGPSLPTMVIGANGMLMERVHSPQEQQALDILSEISRWHMAQLGLQSLEDQ